MIITVRSIFFRILDFIHLLPFLLNNFSAGQPISLCLQNLQAKEPRTNPFPAKERIVLADFSLRSPVRAVLAGFNLPLF